MRQCTSPDGTKKTSGTNKEYHIGSGDLILFNPMENHTCAQIDDRALDYRCLNVTLEVMQKTVYEITGRGYLPEFTTTVAYQSDMVTLLRSFTRQMGITPYQYLETILKTL